MKQLFSKFSLLLLLVIVTMAACKKVDSVASGVNSNPTNPVSTGNPDVDALVNMNAPAAFRFSSDQALTLDITILAPDNTPIGNIPVNVLDSAEESGGTILYTGLTDAQGKLSGTMNVPASLTNVVVDPHYLGVMRNATVSIVSGNVLCVLGGPNVYGGNVIPNVTYGGGRMAHPVSSSHRDMGLPNLAYMGTYTSDGVPNYLEPVGDVITNDYLTQLNYSLPEQTNVAYRHPDFLTSSAETNINITELSDVWFTFVFEGAGYRNTVAYFTYPTGTPPQSAAQIDSLHVILPNASLSGSGGSLKSGMKVKLGRFNAGTSIGFALLADAWNGWGVMNNNWTVYTIDNLNPASAANLKRQSVLLYRQADKKFVIGFEDIRRDYGGCDNDFNDVVFNVTSNPVTGISHARCNVMDVPVDSDGDGVSDLYDRFPNDPTRAYINELPGVGAYGTVAFEDNWPSMGDYDMNDMVVDYNYKLINNAQNNTVEIDAEYVLKAVGATYHNGFGVEFPFASSYVQSVTGTRVVNNDVVSFGANGCEAGQNKAVIIPFDDAFTVVGATTPTWINTFMSSAYHTPDTIRMVIKLNTPLNAATIGNIPFNPFIIINKTRGREAHLPGYTPTQKVNTAYFKTDQDNTDPSQNRYYKTKTNLPYALAFTDNFKYPIEGKAINAAYTNFVSWAQSGGVINTNWYKDPTHTVQANVYNK